MELKSPKDEESELVPFDSGQQRQESQDSPNGIGSLKLKCGLTFGHFSPTEAPSIQVFKDQAWEHLVKTSSMEAGDILQNYSDAISRVQEELERAYLEKPPDMWCHDFRMMLIKDGCFFLQLVLLVLGCHDELGYSPDHIIFGRNNMNRGNQEWIEDMFTVGNQIPLVVLKKFVAQEFFKDIVSKRPKWTPNPSSLIEKAFYELLVLPVLKEVHNQRRPWICLTGRVNTIVGLQRASDLLHGLQILLTGHLFDDYEDDDLEANENGHNLDSTYGDGTALIDHRATNLKRSRIYIKKVESGGIKCIDFQKSLFASYLYLPTFPVDGHTEGILRNIIMYEKQQYRQQREVSSYIKFMSGIVRTKKDAQLLMDSKILEGDPRDVEKLPGILRRLASSKDHNIALTHQLQTVRRRMRDHSSTWTHFRRAINVMVVLTLIQTCLALMAYLLFFLRFNVVS